MHFIATQQPFPATASLKAKLAWSYFYRGYDLIRTQNNFLLITRNNRTLDDAEAFMDEQRFLSHLEQKVDDALQTDKVKFFRSFVMFPELVTLDVAEALERAITPAAPTSLPTPPVSSVASSTSVSTAVNSAASIGSVVSGGSDNNSTRVVTTPSINSEK